MTTERGARRGRQRVVKATTIVLSATLSLLVSPVVAAKIANANSPAERIAVIRAAVSQGKIIRADGLPLNRTERNQILAESPPWGDYGWTKRFSDGRV